MKIHSKLIAMKDLGIMLTVTGVLLLLIVVSVDLFAFYVMDIKAPGYKPDRFFTFHPKTGSFHKPQAEGFWYRYRDGTKYHVRINSFGFADKERSLKKTKPRIALVGDSTVQFWEAPGDQRAHLLIERQLMDEYEILNMGVRGYGNDQAFILFQELGVRFLPDIIVLNFCINDIWDNAKRSNKPYFDFDEDNPSKIKLQGYPLSKKPKDKLPKLQNFLWQHSYVLRRLGLIRHPLLKTSYPLSEQFELRPYKREYNEEDARRWELTTRILLEFKRFLASHNMKLLIVEGLYRPAADRDAQKMFETQYGNIFDFTKVTEMLAKFCADNDVEFISLPQQITQKNIDPKTLMHPEDNLHLNEQGSVLYADVIVQKLKSLNWID